MKENGDVTIDGVTGAETYNINISSQIGTFKVKIEVKNSYKVDLSIGNIRNLLGFDAIEVSVTQVGSSRADITNGLNMLQLHCSLINAGMYMNGSTSDIIYSFVPAGPAGASLSFKNDNPHYIAVRDNRYIDSIRLYVTDQLGRSVNLNGYPLTLLWRLPTLYPDFNSPHKGPTEANVLFFHIVRHEAHKWTTYPKEPFLLTSQIPSFRPICMMDQYKLTVQRVYSV